MDIFLSSEQLFRYNIIEHNILSSKATNSEMTFEDMSRCFEIPSIELRTIATRMINKGILSAEIKSDTLYFSEEDSGYVLAHEIYMKTFNPSCAHRSSDSSTTDSLQSTDSARHRFRKQVIKLSHQNKNMNILKCEISQNKYPAKYLVADHIVKKSFGSTKVRRLFNLSDINDPGNGILMFVSIEYHFDRGNICLVKKNASDDYYHVKILHKDLQYASIIEEGVRLNGGNSPIELCEQPITTTFKDLEAIEIRLDNRYKRLISFHMHMAMKQNQSFDVTCSDVQDHYLMHLVDFWSSEQKQMNYIDKVRRWFDFNDLQTHSVPVGIIKSVVEHKDIAQLKLFGIKEIVLASGKDQNRVRKIIKKLNRICKLKTHLDINEDQKILVGNEEYYWLELATYFTDHKLADSNLQNCRLSPILTCQ